MRFVYALKHNVTGRVYVGSSVHNPMTRVKKHIGCLRRHAHYNELMQKDFDEFGEDYCIYQLDAYPGNGRIEESKWMARLNSKDSQFGYNFKDLTGHSFNFKDVSPVTLEDKQIIGWFLNGKTYLSEPSTKL